MGIALKNNEHLRVVFSQDFTSDETNEIIESFSEVLPTKKSQVATDSAESLDVATAVIVFLILAPIAEGFLKAIGSDIYNKAKEKIINILEKKENPKIIFQFKSAHKGTDIVIRAQTNDKEELNKIFDTIDEARELAVRQLVKNELMVSVNYDEGWILDSEKPVKIGTVRKVKAKQLSIRQRLDRLTIFEAVVVGIYGNWIISFLDGLNFTNKGTILGFSIPYIQGLLVGFTFFTLLIFFVYTIFSPESVTKFFALIMAIGHIVGIGAIFQLEVMTPEGMTMKTWLFYILGIWLYSILFLTEIFRVRFTRKNIDVNRSSTP